MLPLLFARFSSPVPIYANRLKQFFLKGSRAVVPALWHLEMSNALAFAERRSILTSADVGQAMSDLEQILAHAVDTDTTVVPVRQSLATARAFQLSAYNAVYLDLARRERLHLATLDDRLRRGTCSSRTGSVRSNQVATSFHPSR
jgi:predicted nucleic acid-binding protein